MGNGLQLMADYPQPRRDGRKGRSRDDPRRDRREDRQPDGDTMRDTPRDRERRGGGRGEGSREDDRRAGGHPDLRRHWPPRTCYCRNATSSNAIYRWSFQYTIVLLPFAPGNTSVKRLQGPTEKPRSPLNEQAARRLRGVPRVHRRHWDHWTSTTSLYMTAPSR